MFTEYTSKYKNAAVTYWNTSIANWKTQLNLDVNAMIDYLTEQNNLQRIEKYLIDQFGNYDYGKLYVLLFLFPNLLKSELIRKYTDCTTGDKQAWKRATLYTEIDKMEIKKIITYDPQFKEGNFEDDPSSKKCLAGLPVMLHIKNMMDNAENLKSYNEKTNGIIMFLFEKNGKTIFTPSNIQDIKHNLKIRINKKIGLVQMPVNDIVPQQIAGKLVPPNYNQVHSMTEEEIKKIIKKKIFPEFELADLVDGLIIENEIKYPIHDFGYHPNRLMKLSHKEGVDYTNKIREAFENMDNIKKLFSEGMVPIESMTYKSVIGLWKKRKVLYKALLYFVHYRMIQAHKKVVEESKRIKNYKDDIELTQLIEYSINEIKSIKKDTSDILGMNYYDAINKQNPTIKTNLEIL